ncbi:alpha/beta hydrolase [Vibrio cholerae]|uniref:alpha/beta hydrolase n=1 Tax=Vibrio cholerae TaxID=666 RepID=UPI00053C53D5|nr:alpha/beta hydrolase [Vibrio cholerae]EGR0549738.1 alpha/beta hydrolase [Vibrio cholerae]EJL6276268.1 alpha/beta hydrolase [Vibrio cholerae]EJL6580099.1 alpha/beta hydrolase [Vibrio cholerae]EJL6839103.1 alpha/beta hydrolase [Vibrio cholerae]ELH4195616.1 alpha/beta hydrolase [Vibrio cholerae]
MKRFLVSLCISLLGMSNTYANDNYMVTKDITFKTVDGRVLKLDLYKPKAERIQPYPLLIWVHGGAWKRGSKDDIPTKNPLLLSSVLQQGYALAAVNYRLSGEATFPAPVQDINDAVNFLYDNALQFHIKADKVVMMGRSAGGHLAGLMGTTNTHSNLTFYAKPKYQVKAVVSFFGPTDLLALANKGGKETSKQSSVSRFLGDTPSAIPHIAKQASSTSYVNERTPPFIQLHGTVDKQVPLEQSQLLKAKLDEYGINNQLWIEQNVGHSDPIFDTEKHVPKVITFIKEHLPTEPL